jgi:hypothetical protein
MVTGAQPAASAPIPDADGFTEIPIALDPA